MGIYSGRRSSCLNRWPPNWKLKLKNWPRASRPDPPTPSWRWHADSLPPPTSRSLETPSSHSAIGHKASSLMLMPATSPKNGIHHFRNRLPPLLPTQPPSTAIAEKTVETLGGPVTCNRAYYYCGLCAKGSCPWDQRVGLTTHRLSPAVERLATLCGAVADSFEKGTELLQETAGVRLSESTVEPHHGNDRAGDRRPRADGAHLRWQRTVELVP